MGKGDLKVSVVFIRPIRISLQSLAVRALFDLNCNMPIHYIFYEYSVVSHLVEIELFP